MEEQTILNKAGVNQLIAAFDLIPDILFWVKDTKSRIVHANQHFVEHQGYKTLDQILLKTDFDFSPQHLAFQYVNDDKRVMEGFIVTDRLELNQTANGELAWFSTSKKVLLDDENAIMGTYGVTRHLAKTSKALSHVRAIEAPVEFIRAHYHRHICIEELAELAHLSVSALERRFKKHLAKTPNQFINEVRLENARKLLVETRLPVSQVAYQCGFSEPSYFSKQFRRLFGEIPSQLRKELTSSER
ncbi:MULTISPECIES: AraC family transcriptional regulator [Pseudoalteromonas]|uniref:AraC family transcriptional regulator n=1 Tax=Pseudoalteromonas piscicida TaxID=43662 RepID=A0AAQ2EUG3_PSEO7|nr:MULTISPECIES: AraC family transcriptional regulator [Pseudoalteromonas]KJY88007.1 AraC family transcriptional regulator [Pseudoalteromonas piscicida]MCO7197711.1 AraC family transcriptional regulator [Pseudoalteromonas sp. OANN1]MDP4487783.1 AraC family transcriptional regulator [Pseudoalteromonas piscicida]TMN42632.1 AraC family transcriptional regulator [Pseudoalteromonas piscicida]TMN42879.1 AraC family transcriptional regulator [Pseudoalteromonas piscicida]